jgi:hypothetical protein
MSEKDRDFGNEEGNEPEIWDEHRWEEFFRESDKRTDKYILLIEQYMDHPDRDRIIAEQMGWTHRLNESNDEDKDWLADFDMDEYEEGEEWKRLTGYEPTDFDQFDDLPIYQKAHDFAVDAKKMLNKNFADRDDESIQAFSRYVTIPPAKIAGGFGFGFDRESIGGNIANCKRGLYAANKVLDALYDIGEKELFDRELYLEYYSRAKEIRDELGIYIVELRERFKRGFK